jgi:hypothetical protein
MNDEPTGLHVADGSRSICSLIGKARETERTFSPQHEMNELCGRRDCYAAVRLLTRRESRDL